MTLFLYTYQSCLNIKSEKMKPFMRFDGVEYSQSDFDIPQPLPDLAPDIVSSFFPRYPEAFICFAYGCIRAAKRLCHFSLVGIGMLAQICFQFIRVEFFMASNQHLLFQMPGFFVLFFPIEDCWYGNFECFARIFKRVPFHPVFYCPFSILCCIAHFFILSVPLQFLKFYHYNLRHVLTFQAVSPETIEVLDRQLRQI